MWLDGLPACLAGCVVHGCLPACLPAVLVSHLNPPAARITSWPTLPRRHPTPHPHVATVAGLSADFTFSEMGGRARDVFKMFCA